MSDSTHQNMLARLKAVQVVYSQKLNKKPIQWVINDVNHTNDPDEDGEFGAYNEEFLKKLCKYHATMGANIAKITSRIYNESGRHIDNADVILVVILECAIAEILSGLMEKPAITISAWLEITKDFFPEKPPVALVNATLDGVIKNLEL